jgi:hypothetical protein
MYVRGNCADEGTDEEDEDGCEQCWLPAKDVAKRTPRGSRS